MERWERFTVSLLPSVVTEGFSVGLGHAAFIPLLVCSPVTPWWQY